MSMWFFFPCGESHFRKSSALQRQNKNSQWKNVKQSTPYQLDVRDHKGCLCQSCSSHNRPLNIYFRLKSQSWKNSFGFFRLSLWQDQRFKDSTDVSLLYLDLKIPLQPYLGPIPKRKKKMFAYFLSLCIPPNQLSMGKKIITVPTWI